MGKDRRSASSGCVDRRSHVRVRLIRHSTLEHNAEKLQDFSDELCVKTKDEHNAEKLQDFSDELCVKTKDEHNAEKLQVDFPDNIVLQKK